MHIVPKFFLAINYTWTRVLFELLYNLHAVTGHEAKQQLVSNRTVLVDVTRLGDHQAQVEGCRIMRLNNSAERAHNLMSFFKQYQKLNYR